MPTRRPDKAELAYTTKKIEANFSNFSAWHQRTKVLGTLWTSGEIDKASSLHKGVKAFFFWLYALNGLHAEFELVQNAMFTLPEDQSAWLYHRWLIGSGGSFILPFQRAVDIMTG
jgi:geranylgeranyl transferase type-2 subunit alpha